MIKCPTTEGMCDERSQGSGGDGWVVAAGLGLATVGLEGQTMTTPKTIGSLIKADPRFDTLIPPDATIEVLAGGLDWTEGPVWVARRRLPAVLDIPNNRVVQVVPGTGRGAVPQADAATPASASSAASRAATAWRSTRTAGSSLPARRPPRRPARRTDGKFVTLVDKYKGKRLNSPNDLVVQVQNGDLYFTDPPYGLPEAR